jgi:2-polyprenyl-3-methyl-5-hydroxy-6-metoxy-1,4-benzoquinol methylase
MNPKRNWDDFVRFGRLLLKQHWIFAKTMPENPHHYTLRKHWGRDDEFVWAVEYLRANGYTAVFRKSRYVQINVNEHFYWTMGAPIPATILINRKALANNTSNAYDVMADRYDGLWGAPEAIAENRAVFDAIGPLAGKDILEIGCGAGLMLNAVKDEIDSTRYTGIDPSPRMLEHFRSRHPQFDVVQSALYDFVPVIDPASGDDGEFDLILALFGVGSYLTDEELRRIPYLLRPGGRAAVMFYRDGYQPRHHDAPGTGTLLTPWHGQFPGNSHVIGNHVLVIYEK